MKKPRKHLFMIGHYAVRPLHLGAALLLAVIAVGGIWAIRTLLPTAYDGLEFQNKPVLVNNVPISPEAVELQHAQLSDRLSQLPALRDDPDGEVTKTEVLKAMIDQELLKQRAKEEGIAITAEEARSSFEDLLSHSAWSRDEWKGRLDQNGLTEDQFMTQYQENLAVAKLLESHVPISSVAVSEKEVDHYIEANKVELADLIEEGVVDQFRPAIQRRLMAQTYKAQVEDYLDGLRRQADIDVVP